MNFKQERALVIIGAILIIGLAIGLPFIIKPCENLLPSFALSQLAFSAVAFFIIFLALYFTIVRLRKSMAKPKISIYFSENKATEISMDISESQDLPDRSLELWLINNGNAVAKVIQVEFDVPDYFNPTIHPKYNNIFIVPPRFSNGGYIRTISFYSIDNYCFVGLPINLISFVLERHKDLVGFYHPDEFKISYRVYGDWAETQEGELKVMCKKN